MRHTLDFFLIYHAHYEHYSQQFQHPLIIFVTVCFKIDYKIGIFVQKGKQYGVLI